MPCDAVLLSGTAIVNESMLTGESVPVMKTALPCGEEEYETTKHKKFTLFGGTSVIQTRYYRGQKVLAVVVNTAFWTAKGSLVRSILFPKPLNVKLWKDSIKFVMALAVLAVFGVIYSLTINLVNHYDVGETIFRSLDVVTILVPPALPAALTVSTVYAIARLKKQKISCISPQRINLSGKVKLACFDKTGTLTEDSLDLLGVKSCVPVKTSSHNQKWSLNTDKHFVFSEFVREPSTSLSHDDLLIHGMATCHSLTLIKGELSGDPLDLKLFAATGWVLEEPDDVESSRYNVIVPCVVHPSGEEPSVELGVMKQFTFSSDLKRMSVLVRTLPVPEPNRTEVFVKGAPEILKDLCSIETLPVDFDEVLSSLAKQGFRIIALGHKVMYIPWHKMEAVSRESVECDLQFLGLLVMQNKLKPETAPVIQELEDANIRTVMATGDNILTAVCVARQCGMVDEKDIVQVKAQLDSSNQPIVTYHLLSGGGYGQIEYSLGATIESVKSNGDEHINIDNSICLAIDGNSFNIVVNHHQDLIPKLLVYGKVFARVSPSQKQLLVEELQGIGYSTVMCGDGANDCGVSEPVTIAYMRILLAMYEICVLHLLNTCVGAC
jgi:predicted P-type ATPase